MWFLISHPFFIWKGLAFGAWRGRMVLNSSNELDQDLLLPRDFSRVARNPQSILLASKFS
jgi:hypothetical protein